MELIFARHGQASFGQANYDALSELGRRQSALLGAWLAAKPSLPIDVAVSGSMQRQRDTLAAITQARGDLPAAVQMPAFNEFDHVAMLAAFERLSPDDPVVRAMADGQRADVKAIFKFLHGGLRAWVDGRIDDAVPESFGAFRARVLGGVAELRERFADAQRVLVVSSGGVMSQVAQHALGVPDSHAIDLNLSIRNSALAEFRFADGRWRLGSWNALPHLAGAEDRALHTFY